MRNNRAFFFLLIFALALIVRVAWLDKFPPGLWFDEGLKGVDAWRTLHGGGFLLIYPDVFPREPLFVWILSIPLKIFGPRIIVLRLTVALLGSLAVALLFLMAGSVERRRGVAFALTVAFVMATMHWPAHFSRLIFRTNLVPLVSVLLVLAMSAASRATPRRKSLAWLGAGAVAGIGQYTYLSWWFFLPVILVWFWAFQIPEEEESAEASTPTLEPSTAISPTSANFFTPASLRNLLFFAIGALVVFSPLAIHYARFPEHLIGRPEAISPFATGFLNGLDTIWHNIVFVLSMFSYKGDHVPKHNVPWTPVLDVAWSIFFYGGILLAIKEAGLRTGRGRRAWAWLAWLFFMSLPTVFSQTDSANTLRNLGATPAVAFFVASGWWWIYGGARNLKANWVRPVQLILIAALFWGAGFQVYKEWVRHPNAPGVADNFNVLHVELSRLTQPDPSGALLFVPTDFYTHKTFEFLTIQRKDIRPFDPVAILSKDPAHPVDHRILCTMLSPNSTKLMEAFPNIIVEGPSLYMGRQPFAWVLRIPASSLLPPDKAEEEARKLSLTTEK